MVKKILNAASINDNTFKGHSTRSVSSSKAVLSGISTEDVLKKGSCSNESTILAKIYETNIYASIDI